MEKIRAYSPSGTEKIIHRSKSGHVYRLDAIDQPVRIKDGLLVDPRFEVVDISRSDDSVLFQTHSKELINSYRTGQPIELAQSSGLLWQNDFYPWVVNKAWATIEAVKEAVANGRSIAITSGGHHAEFEHGRGFGPISNMVIAAKELLAKEVVKKIAILDLDVHYANGTHSQVVGESRILSCDIWKYKLPYWKFTPNARNIYHTKVDNKKEYFEALDLMFERIDGFKPELLFFYNGLDPLSNDRMGGVKDFGENELFERNKLVSSFIEKNNLPVCVFMGGGYIDYSKPNEQVEKDKTHLTELFIKSTASVFDLV